MIQFSRQVIIHDFAEVIWHIMADVEHWNEWTPTINRIQKLTGTGFGKGTRLLIEQPALPKAVWKVNELETNRHFTLVKGNLFLKVTATHTLEPVRDGTAVTLSLAFSGIFAKRVAAKYQPLMETYLAMEAEGLQKKVSQLPECIF